MTDHTPVIDYVFSILGAVPHETYGAINAFPFAVESEQTNQIKREYAEGLVKSMDAQGFIASPDNAAPKITRQIRVLCRSCGTALFSGTTDHDGGITVAAPALLTTLARLRAECPHTAFTPEDQRAFIESAVE